MQAEQVARVRAAARAEGLLSVNNRAGALTVVVELAVTAAIIGGLTLVDRWSVAFWLLQLAAGVSIFRWFVILHECGHRSLFSRRVVNSIVGHLASVACLIPYFCWRDVHQQHHRWVGVIDKDPTQAHLLKLRDASTVQNTLFRIVWRLWLPIPFAQFLWKVFWGYPRHAAASGDRAAARRGWLSIGVVVTAHTTIIVGLGWLTWMACFVPMLIVFYVIIENFNLPQHSGLFPYLSTTHPQPVPFGEQDEITRSSHLPDALSTLLALNFNRHVEHHIFPSAPWYSLNRLRRVMADTGYRNPNEVPFMSYMRTVRRQDPLTIYRDALPRPTDETERIPRVTIHITLEPTQRLTATDRAGITEVFATTFEAPDPAAGLAGYFERFEHVFVGRDGVRIVGFQFYRRRRVAGRDIHHFSLAGRLPGRAYAGMQRRFGVALVKRAILSTVPWRPVYLAGVTNNPRSYRNMHVSGGRVFPDVLQPSQRNPFAEWYGEVAAALDIPITGESGMVPDRMAALGFGLAETSGDSDDAMTVAYDRYVEGRREDGIFTIVEIKLARDLRRLLRTRPASRRSTPAPAPARATI